MRTAALIDTLSPHATTTGEDISKVYCPECKVYISSSDSDLVTHFEDKKSQDGVNSWHIHSLKAPVAGQKKDIFIHRERDLKCLCPCGFSDYEKHAIQVHLASVSTGNRAAHAKSEWKPSWSRK